MDTLIRPLTQVFAVLASAAVGAVQVLTGVTSGAVNDPNLGVNASFPVGSTTTVVDALVLPDASVPVNG